MLADGFGELSPLHGVKVVVGAWAWAVFLGDLPRGCAFSNFWLTHASSLDTRFGPLEIGIVIFSRRYLHSEPLFMLCEVYTIVLTINQKVFSTLLLL